MASPTLQRLLRNQQSQPKIMTYLRQPLSPTQIPKPYDSTFSNHPKSDDLKPDRSSCAHIYPSFPFGFFLDPISPTLLTRPEIHREMDQMVQDESVIIRADSVKKKRKKKMNKHKLRKLRKRLRRKTKA